MRKLNIFITSSRDPQDQGKSLYQGIWEIKQKGSSGWDFPVPDGFYLSLEFPEAKLAEFPNGTVDLRVGIFLSPLNTTDRFFFSHTIAEQFY